MRKYLFILIYLLTQASVYAQLSTNEFPISYDSKVVCDANVLPEAVVMPELNMEAITIEDMKNEANNMPLRFGYRHKVNFSLTNSGIWRKLPNGDKLWQLRIVCPNAKSINLLYNKFWLPEGGKLFLYSTDKKHHLGAYTSRNNKGDRMNLRGFASGLIFDDDIVLEYYQPKEVVEDAIISIESIVHGYRIISHTEVIWDTITKCQININCADGHDWQCEKRAVALMLAGEYAIGTGALVNTTNNSRIPYFLTANHCLRLFIDEYWGSHDAEKDSILDFFSFYWNYEASGCSNIQENITFFSTNGAVVLANDSVSDFALLRLTEDPKNIVGYTPYYLGWDNSGNSGTPGVCIHHPYGCVKKIVTVDSIPSHGDHHGNYNANGMFWRVFWLPSGNTRPCSSGSPLLNGAHRVIGQLKYGNSYCFCAGPDAYGRFDISWDNKSSITRQLSHWLNPYNNSQQTLDGLLVVTGDCIFNIDQQAYGNIIVKSGGQLIITADVNASTVSSMTIESGGKLIIDGGYLNNANITFQSGSSLDILYGGVLDIQGDFVSPLGVLINIEQGSIQ